MTSSKQEIDEALSEWMEDIPMILATNLVMEEKYEIPIEPNRVTVLDEEGFDTSNNAYRQKWKPINESVYLKRSKCSK